jgi:hypothetical protein
MPPEQLSKPSLLEIFVADFLLRPSLNCDLPVSISQVAGITDVSYHTQPLSYSILIDNTCY